MQRTRFYLTTFIFVIAAVATSTGNAGTEVGYAKVDWCSKDPVAGKKIDIPAVTLSCSGETLISSCDISSRNLDKPVKGFASAVNFTFTDANTGEVLDSITQVARTNKDGFANFNGKLDNTPIPRDVDVTAEVNIKSGKKATELEFGCYCSKAIAGCKEDTNTACPDVLSKDDFQVRAWYREPGTRQQIPGKILRSEQQAVTIGLRGQEVVQVFLDNNCSETNSRGVGVITSPTTTTTDNSIEIVNMITGATEVYYLSPSQFAPVFDPNAFGCYIFRPNL